MDLETTYEDGARQWEFSGAFVDMQRAADGCFIEENGSGGYACLPLRVRGIEAFADDSCSSPVAAVAFEDYSPGRERYIDVGEKCAPRIVKTDGITRGQAFVKNASGRCVEHFYDGWVVSDPQIIAMSAFGSFTRSKETKAFPGERSGTRLTFDRWRFTGEDGSFEVRAPRIVDSVRGSTGQILKATDGSLRLFTAFSTVRALSSAFTDATCTTSVLGFEKDDVSCEDDPLVSKDALVVQATAIPGCNAVRLFSAPSGAPLSAVYYRGGGGTCEGDDPPSAMRVYPSPAIAEVPNDALAELTEQIISSEKRSKSGARLEARMRVRSSADGLELQERDSRLYLRKYDVPCSANYLVDEDELHCVPEVPWERDGDDFYFGDASCTQMLVALEQRGLCTTPPPLYRDRWSFRFFRRQGDSVGTVYVKTFDGCMRQDTLELGITFYPRGTPEEVPSTEFPRMVKQRAIFKQ